MEASNGGMLSPYRVLDLTEDRSYICGKVLGDLGADVIKIEKPGGDRGRNLGPFYQDIPHPERSLYWLGFNTSKRGITLNLETADGQELFKKLVQKADIVIESYPVGYLDRIGLGYQVLSQINPGLILASISGFGQEGPYRDLKAPEIVIWALAGEAYMTGDADRAPLYPSFPIVYSFAGTQAAIGILVALYQRGITGEGQQIDIPAFLGIAWASGPEMQGLWALDKTLIKRTGGIWARAQTSETGEVSYINIPLIYPCKNGGVKFFPFVEEGMLPSTDGLTRWVIEEGFASETLKKLEWRTWNWQAARQEIVDDITGCFRRFFLSHTKAELWEGARKRGIQSSPLFTAEDILSFPQLQAREYWQKVEYSYLGTSLTYPGAFAKLAQGSCALRRRAPRIGEHNAEIYTGELGLSPGELVELRQANVI
ncbi:MAG: CoA transferase [Chloroflexi bacterium]|jgi:benzylsuccinate CoA-transferase BbsE subunit|nr:CoA transferase [Chloroflexota bacterium]